MTCKIDERIYTHKRKARHGIAIQFTETNADVILAQLRKNINCSAEIYVGNPDMILVRNRIADGISPSIYTLYVGDWLLTGENGVTKRYSDAQFKVKYEAL